MSQARSSSGNGGGSRRTRVGSSVSWWCEKCGVCSKSAFSTSAKRLRALLRQGVHQVEIEVVDAGILRLLDPRSACAASWMRPMRWSAPSSKLCTPKLIRLMPARGSRRNGPCSTVPGIVSSVISSPGQIQARGDAVENARDAVRREQARRAAAEEDARQRPALCQRQVLVEIASRASTYSSCGSAAVRCAN